MWASDGLSASSNGSTSRRILVVATALERNPDMAAASDEFGHDVGSHGHRWIGWSDVGAEVDHEHIARATELIVRLTGRR